MAVFRECNYKHDLKPLVMGVKGLNRETGELIRYEEVYDPKEKQWISIAGAGEPSTYQSFKTLLKLFRVSHDVKTGMVTVSVESLSPEVSKNIVENVMLELNSHFQNRDMIESQRNIKYLGQKITETSLAEMQAVFYGMVETQMKTLMLTEVEGEYLLKTVVAPYVSEVKSSPNRLLIVIAIVFLALVASLMWILLRYFVGRVL